MKLLRREQARAAGSWGRRPTPWAAPGEGGPPCTPSLLIFCSGRVRTRIQGGTARRQTSRMMKNTPLSLFGRPDRKCLRALPQRGFSCFSSMRSSLFPERLWGVNGALKKKERVNRRPFVTGSSARLDLTRGALRPCYRRRVSGRITSSSPGGPADPGGAPLPPTRPAPTEIRTYWLLPNGRLAFFGIF